MSSVGPPIVQPKGVRIARGAFSGPFISSLDVTRSTLSVPMRGETWFLSKSVKLMSLDNRKCCTCC